VLPPELLVLTEEVKLEDELEGELLLSNPGVSTSPDISATASTAAIAPETRALFLLLI